VKFRHKNDNKHSKTNLQILGTTTCWDSDRSICTDECIPPKPSTPGIYQSVGVPGIIWVRSWPMRVVVVFRCRRIVRTGTRTVGLAMLVGTTLFHRWNWTKANRGIYRSKGVVWVCRPSGSGLFFFFFFFFLQFGFPVHPLRLLQHLFRISLANNNHFGARSVCNFYFLHTCSRKNQMEN